MSKPWARRAGESARAYAAFLAYRDFGPGRSIDKAFAGQSGTKAVPRAANGQWGQWSTDHDWVERAEAWDAHNEELREREFQKRLKELAHEQAEFAVEEFHRLVKRVRRADGILSRADDAPVYEVEEEIVENGKVTGRKRIKPLNFAGYAALMKEIRDSAQRAILGPRDGADDEKKGVAAAEGAPTRIVWADPDPEPEPEASKPGG